MRPLWNDFWMMQAKQISTRSTCTNRRVGCIIVDAEDNVLSIGYNGARKGIAHCRDTGVCWRGLPGKRDDNCIAVHAEANAVLRAESRGVSLQGARAYITMSPCSDCTEMLIDAGVKHIYYELLHHADNPDPCVPTLIKASDIETYEQLVIPLEVWQQACQCLQYPTSRKRTITCH